MRISYKALAAILAVMAPAALAAPAAKAPAKVSAAKTTHAKPARAAQKVAPAKAPATELSYIGTFTNETGSPRSEDHGQGVYAADLNLKTGHLDNLRLAAKTPSPSWMAIDQARGILYAANGYNGFGDERTGSVTAFTIDRTTGNLSPINTVGSGGAPIYIVRDPSGKYLVTANWNEGSISVLSIRADGGVGDLVDLYKPTGPKSPERAEDDPPGNYSASSHAHSRVHMVSFDPSGRYLIADDAGLDQVHVLKLDPATGKLSPATTSFAETPGAAPRHFAFSPNGRIFYNLLEQDSKLGVYAFDPDKGSFTLKQKLSNLPDGFEGSTLASELLITNDGKYLYAANRTHDTIVTYAVQKDGTVKKIGETACENDGPRSIALDLTEKFLYSMNQRGDDVTVFTINPKTHVPHFTGQALGLGSPAAMVFVAPEKK